MKAKTIAIGAVILIILAAAGFVYFSKLQPAVGIVGDVHEHADFKVYLNGVAFNFSVDKYMSDLAANRTLSNFVHLHDGNGNIIHKHAPGVTLGMFFSSIGMSLSSDCFVTDFATEFCNKDGTGLNKRILRFYVNGIPNSAFGDYEFHDLDRILITYGNQNEQEIAVQIGSVSADACIYSEKCPEKGSPPTEFSCVGSGDCAAEP